MKQNFFKNYPLENDHKNTEAKIQYLLEKLSQIKHNMQFYYNDFKHLGKKQFEDLYGIGKDKGQMMYFLIVL